MSFGTQIQKLRMERGYTQEELAEMLRVSRSCVSHYEQGLRYPSVPMIQSLAETLGGPIDFFFETGV